MKKENQMHVHYAMPVRTMLYEALDYTKQCKALEQAHRKNRDLQGADEFLSGLVQNDKIKPAITLIVYYGEKPWDGPLNLSDMMNIPPAFHKFFNNYALYLLEVNKTKEYHFQNQDNQDFFTLIGEFYSNSKMDIIEFKDKHGGLNIYWETMAALGAATGSEELVEYAINNQGGRIHMCTALENLKQEGIKEGIQEGIKEGIHQGEIRGMIKAYKNMNFSEEIIVFKLKEEFNLSKEEIMDYLHQLH